MSLFVGKDLNKIQNVHVFVAALQPDDAPASLVPPKSQLLLIRGQLLVTKQTVEQLITQQEKHKAQTDESKLVLESYPSTLPWNDEYLLQIVVFSS